MLVSTYLVYVACLALSTQKNETLYVSIQRL